MGETMERYKIFIVILPCSILNAGVFMPCNLEVEKAMKPAIKKVIIFDLDGVLFKENKPAFVKKVGFGDLAKYTLRTWSTPESICLDTLDCISKQEQQPAIRLMHRGRAMPRVIMDWQLGHKTHTQVRTELAENIDALAAKNHFKNDQDKNLTKRILDISLNPEHLADITAPIPAMVRLAEQLEQKGYKL